MTTMTTVPAGAENLFSTTATNGGATVTSTGDNLLDLLEDAVETQGAFNSLNGTNFTAVTRYADVANAIRINVNAAETQATLEFPGTGFTRVFTGSDADDLQDEIREFIETDGGTAYAAFLADLNRRSLISVLDGNPFSTTALTNEHLFDSYGLGSGASRFRVGRRAQYPSAQPPYATPNDTLDAPPADDTTLNGTPLSYSDDGSAGWSRDSVWLSLTPRFHTLDAAGFDGTAASFGFSSGYWFTDQIAVAVGGNVHVNEYENTYTYHSSFNLALPIRAVDTGDAQGGFALELTPFLISGLGGSIDAAAGGAFYGYGGAVNATLSLGVVQLKAAAQYVDFNDQDLEYDEFEFDTELDQSAVTLGGSIVIFLDGPHGHWWIDGGITPRGIPRKRRRRRLATP